MNLNHDELLPFEVALRALKDGKRITRLAWRDINVHIALCRSSSYSEMTLPYIYMATSRNNKVPYSLTYSY